jgi:hypothetical protein
MKPPFGIARIEGVERASRPRRAAEASGEAGDAVAPGWRIYPKPGARLAPFAPPDRRSVAWRWRNNSAARRARPA